MAVSSTLGWKTMRKKVPRTRAGGSMTEGAFRSFIKSGLRRMSTRWKPKYDVKKAARHYEKLPNLKGRMVFHSECNMCQDIVPETTATVDHITPIINPHVGFTNWDDVIYALFCEADGLQVLCKPCHDSKTKEEKAIDTERRRQERTA